MSNELDNVKTEFKKAEDEHNSKMAKAKAFFENEMKALKSMSHSSDEDIKQKYLIAFKVLI